MIEKVALRTDYNYDREKASNESAIAAFDESKTKQSFAEECDINVIWSRYVQTGDLPVKNRVAPMYGDFTDIPSYQDALHAVKEAGVTFNLLPAEVRARFQNDPGEFVDFCSNDDNRAQIELWGLTVPKPQTEGNRMPSGGPKEEKGPPGPITASKELVTSPTPAEKPTK